MAINSDYDDAAATAQMCMYCFDVLLHKLSNGVNDHDISIAQSQYIPPKITCPLFVTWDKYQSPHPPLLSELSSSGNTTPADSSREPSSIVTDDDTSTHNHSNAASNNSYEEDFSAATSAATYELRGCIGALAPRQLQHALAEFAVTSALHDRRFDPISLHELPMLRVGVSLLVKYEECKDCFDWMVGIHGIIIKFDNTGRGGRVTEPFYSATYLPEVAKEQSWTQKEAIFSLIRKAGYHGSITYELLSQIHCTRYQSSKYQLSYQEYVMEIHGGKDPLKSAELAAAVAAEEMARKRCRVKPINPCVNL